MIKKMSNAREFIEKNFPTTANIIKDGGSLGIDRVASICEKYTQSKLKNNGDLGGISGSIPEFAKKQIEAKKDSKRLKGGQTVGRDVQLTELDIMDLIVSSIQNYR